MANEINTKPNTFQLYLVPAKSYYVRKALQKAGEWGQNEQIIYSYILATALAISAVILSIFNTISYVLHIPIKMLLNIIRFHPLSLIFDLVNDVSSALQSFLFVSFGVAFVVAGIFFPANVYPYFAPQDHPTSKEVLNRRVNELTEEKNKLTQRVEELEVMRDNLPKYQDRINYLKGQLKKKQEQSKKGWYFW